MYEFFEHTADLGLRARAPTLDALFNDAAEGLFSVLLVNLESVRRVTTKTFELHGAERDLLLFDWLNELLYTFDAENLLLTEFDVRVDQQGLQASCRGEPLDPARHEMIHEVKAITYHGLKVEPLRDGWLAEVVVDI